MTNQKKIDDEEMGPLSVILQSRAADAPEKIVAMLSGADGPVVAELALAEIDAGLNLKYHGSNLSFVQACISKARPDVLRAVVKSGAPKSYQASTRSSKSKWLSRLTKDHTETNPKLTWNLSVFGYAATLANDHEKKMTRDLVEIGFSVYPLHEDIRLWAKPGGLYPAVSAILTELMMQSRLNPSVQSEAPATLTTPEPVSRRRSCGI